MNLDFSKKKKTRFQHDSSVLIDDCSVAVWALVVSSSEVYFDLITRDVADGSSEHQWQCLAHLARVCVFPRVSFTSKVFTIARLTLLGFQASSRSIGVFFTRARCVRAFWPPRVHVAATSSPLSEQRLDASEGVGATDAWRQICGLPRPSRRRLRHFRWLEQVETEGGKLSARECAALAKA